MRLIESLESRLLFATFRPDVDWASAGTYADSDSTLYVRPVGVQPDGKLLVNNQKNVIRLDARGKPDRTWTPIALADQTMEQLPSGRLVRFLLATRDNLLPITRYRPDGSIDKGWGVNGTRTVSFATSPRPGTRLSYVMVQDLAETPDGGLAVLLHLYFQKPNSLSDVPPAQALLKFDSRGRPDRAFTGTGSVLLFDNVTPRATIGVDRLGRISIGKIVQYDTVHIQRFNANGTPDRTLNGAGQIYVNTKHDLLERGADDFGPRTDVPIGFAPDGGFYYYDVHATATQVNFGGLRRRDASGALDGTYGRNGWLRGNGGYHFQADGSLFILGDRTVAHYNAAGALDGSLWKTGTAELAMVSDGWATYLFTRHGVFFNYGKDVIKQAPRASVAVSSAGVLYVAGDRGDDVIDVRMTDRGLRVQIGETAQFVRRTINGVYAELDDGNNVFTSNLDLPTTVMAGKGDDTITTAGGRDFVITGHGNALVRTGGGRDYVEFSGPTADVDLGAGGGTVLGSTYGRSTLRAGGGQYVIELRGFEHADDSLSPSYDVQLSGGIYRLKAAGAPVDLRISSPYGSEIDVEYGNRLILGDGDDTVRAAGSSSIDGRGGNDTIVATDSPFISSTIVGGDGDDIIAVNGAKNIVYGGAGNDRIQAGAGDDTLYGNEGDDTLTSTGGSDRLLGGPGRDRLYARDRTLGKVGTIDYLDGGTGRDTALADLDDTLLNLESIQY